jgi:hypothetical protein
LKTGDNVCLNVSQSETSPADVVTGEIVVVACDVVSSADQKKRKKTVFATNQ